MNRRARHFVKSGSLTKFCDALLTLESYDKLTNQVHAEVDLERKKKGLQPMEWGKMRKKK